MAIGVSAIDRSEMPLPVITHPCLERRTSRSLPCHSASQKVAGSTALTALREDDDGVGVFPGAAPMVWSFVKPRKNLRSTMSAGQYRILIH